MTAPTWTAEDVRRAARSCWDEDANHGGETDYARDADMLSAYAALLEAASSFVAAYDLCAPAISSALIDPRTDAVRYVGKTVRTARRRLRRHMAECYLAAGTHKDRWLRALRAKGYALRTSETRASRSAWEAPSHAMYPVVSRAAVEWEKAK